MGLFEIYENLHHTKISGYTVLVLIDAHSKCVEAVCTPGATSVVIDRTIFARFGIPKTIVSDNGTCLVSTEFEEFLARNGIKHLTSAPYHLSSNVLAERAVHVIKQGLKKNTRGSMKSLLAQVLFRYGITPQTTTQRT